MLSFSTNHANHLKKHATEVFWLLQLFYNDETAGVDVTYLSDQDRVVNSNQYLGLVQWGNIKQILDFDHFKTNSPPTTITLINTPNTIEGGRFSDLLSSNNYTYRTWKIFQTDNNNPSENDQIAEGIIGTDFPYNHKIFTLKLLDLSQKWHKEIPIYIVDASNYPDAPENNLDQPIPIFYGNLHDITGIGTIPPTGAEFDRHFSNKVLAIVTNKWDETNARIEAKLDNETMNLLDVKNAYMLVNGIYCACENNNVNIGGNPVITVTGEIWRAYFKLHDHNTGLTNGSNWERVNDNSFSNAATMNINAEAETSGYLRIGKIPKLGEYLDINILIDFGIFNGTPVPFGANDIEIGIDPGTGETVYDLNWNGGDQTISIDTAFDVAEKEAWDFESIVRLHVDNRNNVGTPNVGIREIGLEIEFTPPQGFQKKIETIETREALAQDEDRLYFEGKRASPREVHITTIKSAPKLIDYIHVGGKGRQYGNWIDTIDGNTRDSENGSASDPGYAEYALIENAVYMIEHLQRNELEMDSGTDGSDIDIESYDIANVLIINIFGVTSSNVPIAHSQYKFINSKEYIDRICLQSGMYFFFSGSGKTKLVIRQRRTYYDNTDSIKTIDFNNINLNDKIKKTPAASIRNYITINYDFDYGLEQTVKSSTPIDNPSQKSNSSAGTGFGGHSRNISKGVIYSKLTFDMDMTRSTNRAERYGDYLLDIYSRRKTIIKFSGKRSIYNDLEIGDIINFTNWHSDFNIYGEVLDSDNVFMITETNKLPNQQIIECIEVS